MNHPQQKIALISGATNGFGRETALLLAKEGYRVYAGYRSQERGEALLSEAKKTSLPFSVVRLDITEPETISKAIQTVVNEAGRIDILINNAGYGLAGSLEDLDVDEIRKQFETNVFGHIMLTQKIIPHMRDQRSGTILFVSSMAGQVSYPLFSAYSSSKHAIEAIGESLRYELKPFGIRSIILEPGMFQTGFVKQNLQMNNKTMRPDSPYQKAAKDAWEEYSAKDSKSPGPEVVARKILKILKSARPKLRYQVGADSYLTVLLKRVLPSSWFECIMSKILKVDQYHV